MSIDTPGWLRHEQRVLRRGTFRLAGAHGPMAAWVRWLGDTTALVVINSGESTSTLTVEAPELLSRTLVSAPPPGDAAPASLRPASATFDVSLPARMGRVFIA